MADTTTLATLTDRQRTIADVMAQAPYRMISESAIVQLCNGDPEPLRMYEALVNLLDAGIIRCGGRGESAFYALVEPQPAPAQ